MAGGIAFAVALVAVFGRSLYELAVYVMGTTLHSHVVLIPFISAYLIGIDRARLPRAGKAWYAFAAPLAAVGLIVWLLVYRTAGAWSENDRLAGITFSFLCLLSAGCSAFFGREWMRAAAFPLGFLIFMVPLPDTLVHWLETGSKFASAEAAAFLLGITATPMLRDGLILRFPGIALEVAQECSGIRSSWVLFITSVLASHLFLRSNWRRAALVLFVIPLGVIRNGFRISVLAWLCVYYSPDMINSIIHSRGGPLFFVLSLGPLFALLWWLRRGEARSGTAERTATRSSLT
jgi:exosortase C (VPDSG-CTERM-specific)